MIEPSSELSAVLRRFLDALERFDEPAIRAMMSTDENTLILGSDPREWYQGSEAVELLLVQSKEIVDFSYEIERVEAFQSKDCGWAAADVTARYRTGQTVSLRTTAVFILNAGIWRVVHWNMSLPRPDNPEVIGAELSATMEALLGSVDAGTDLATLRERLRTGTVTIVFTDLEDSTRHNVETGDNRWSELIHDHYKSLGAIAEQNGGVLVKTLGDGAMLAFSSARGAVLAASEMQSIVEGTANSANLRMRVGIHTGEAIRLTEDYFGQTVNLAARLAGAAKPGTTLVSDVVRGLVEPEDGFEFGDPLSFNFKGIDEPQLAYAMQPD